MIPFFSISRTQVILLLLLLRLMWMRRTVRPRLQWGRVYTCLEEEEEEEVFGVSCVG